MWQLKFRKKKRCENVEIKGNKFQYLVPVFKFDVFLKTSRSGFLGEGNRFQERPTTNLRLKFNNGKTQK